MIRKFILPILAVAMLIVAVVHVVRTQQPKPVPEPLYPTIPPAPEDCIAGIGVIEPVSEVISIGVPVPGVVVEVGVTPGQEVHEGDLLFRLDDRQIQGEIKLRRANLQTAQAQLARLEQMPRPEEIRAGEAGIRELEARLVADESRYRKGESMFAKKQISEDELTNLKQTAQMTRERLARLRAEHDILKAGTWEADKAVSRALVTAARAQLEATETELNRLTVKAPIRGTILQVHVRKGEFVGATQSPPVVMGDLRTLHMRVDIDAHDLPRFQAGTTARAFPRGSPHPALSLTFVRTIPILSPKRSLTGDITERVDTRVLQVIYALEDIKHSLYPGQLADVYIPVKGE